MLFGRLTMAKEVLEVEESKIAGVEEAGITFALPESLKLETSVSLEGGKASPSSSNTKSDGLNGGRRGCLFFAFATFWWEGSESRHVQRWGYENSQELSCFQNINK